MSGQGGTLTIGGFYGNKNKRKWIGLENAINSVVERHQKEKIPKSFPLRITGPTRTWQTFFRQQEAFQFCKSTSKELHVIAFESGSFERNTGQRLYLAASYPVFWHYYKQLDEDKRLHYEVIPEGAVCKLYFDLEYDRSMNPDSDGNFMMDIFIKYVCLALKSVFNVRCSREDVLDLDASTEKKFSRHLIFQLKNTSFKDNIHAGRFVSSIMSKLLEKIQSPDVEVNENLQSTGINKQAKTEYRKDFDSGRNVEDNDEDKGGTDDDINRDGADDHRTGVDKHRNGYERQTNSCDNHRTGKDKHPSGSDENRKPVDYHDNGEHRKGDVNDMVGVDNNRNDENEREMRQTYQGSDVIKEEMIEKSNKSNVGKSETNALEDVFASFEVEDLQTLIVKNKNGDDTLFCDTGVYTKNRNFRLFLSSKLGKNNPLKVAEQNEFCSHRDSLQSKEESIFHDSLVANVKYCSSMRILTFDGGESDLVAWLPGRRKDRAPQETECIDGYNKSPYPEVYEYIRSIIAGDSGKGVIRHWTYFHQGELLVYEIAKYRYCHNIGRHHRSNNIMLIADLQKAVWYQKCHDPDCHTQNYKSPEWPLPRDILPASYFADDFDLDQEMDDDELLNTTAELEKQYMEQEGQRSGFSELDDGADDELVAAVTELQGSVNQENG